MTSRARQTELIILLGTLTAFAPMSIDMYLPALPSIGVTFSATAGQVQLSLASFFLGMAAGQAFYGPLTDRFGRKRPLFAGLSLFVIASAGCALSASIDMLIALRFFQALGGCSGPVIARAVVRDLFDPREAVRVFSLMVLVLGVSPVLAPLVGAQILRFFDWRIIFGITTLFGASALAATAWRLPETHRPEHMRPLALKPVLEAYRVLITDGSFIGYALTGATGLGAMFAYIAGSPFVFIDYFHVPATQYGAFFGVNALGFVMAAQLNVRLSKRFETGVVIRTALIFQTIASLLLAAGTWTGSIGLYGTASLIFIYMACAGSLFPNTTAMAMAGHADKAGSASALIGTLQFTLAAIAASTVGALNNATPLPMAATIAACGVFAFAFHWLLIPGARGSRPATYR
jgi:DHA1 family bicyclomycin/chloramphenicol resistance-like MFS transporter